jgi:hypothetical protein
MGDNYEIKVNTDNEIELIDKKGRHMPIQNFGTGIQQIISFGIKIAAENSEKIFIIDEIETNLHASAQRAILQFLSKMSQHTFFIATHSNAIIDLEIPNKNIYHVTKDEDGYSKVTPVKTMNEAAKAVADLGIRPSELIQTNGLIWVEGPSDRIYIKRWLELLEPNLKEGLHYSFSYYTGKLLSHYSTEDESLGGEVFSPETLDVLKVNRNAFFVMDSDKKNEADDIREVKINIQNSCEELGIGTWITQGREIENYLTDRTLSIIQDKLVKREQYKKIAKYCPIFAKQPKVAFAKKITEHIKIDDVKGNMDLEEKIKLLADTIKSWQ